MNERAESVFLKRDCNKRKTRRDKKRHFNLLMEFDVDQISREYSSGMLPWGSILFFFFADEKRCHYDSIRYGLYGYRPSKMIEIHQ